MSRFSMSGRALRLAPSSAAAAVAVGLLVGAAPAAAMSVTVGSPGPDRLKAPGSGGALYGAGGSDTLTGGNGDDRLYGGRGDNRISGGGGDDYIEGGAGSDVIDGGPGNNTIFGSSGQDKIVAGDGNNYVDVGGGHDSAALGNGNNVLVTASGGGTFSVGNGNNTIYYGSGIVSLRAGSGVNHIYLSASNAVRELDCGGNPATVVAVNTASINAYSLQILARKAKGCATITTYDGNARITAQQATPWDAFALVGGDGRDKLFGGHGGGTIDGGGGDNEIWADQYEDTGLPRSQGFTTRITAGDGNNRIFGGRGTNIITAGNGNNFVRAGAWVNDITVGGGTNQIQLQGAKSTNTITIRGRVAGSDGSYVESLANGKRPQITCTGGGRAAIVYGNTKPKTNCRPVYAIRSKQGERLQIERTPGVPAADPIMDGQLQPGDQGIGVPRPVPAG